MFTVRKLLKNKHLPFISRYFCSNNNYNVRVDPRKDYYAILQVPHNASPYDIKQAYLRLQNSYNPYVKQAYDVLSNFTLREQYHKMRSQNYSEYAGQNRSEQDQKFYKDYASSRPNLTPEEQQMADKLNTYLKRTLYVIIGLIMFGPFFFWKGGNKPPQQVIADSMYPRRYGGMAMSRPDQYHQNNQDPRIYPQNQMYPQNQAYPPNPTDIRMMGPPGYTVTGKIVYD